MKPIEIPEIAKSILFVDDERIVLKGLTQILEEEGFFVFAYNNGLEALEDIEKGFIKYDLAIIDYSLGGLSGEDVIQMSKKHNPTTPVIGFSGHGNYQMMGTSKALLKPIEIYNFFNAIIEVTTKSSFIYKSNEELGF